MKKILCNALLIFVTVIGVGCQSNPIVGENEPKAARDQCLCEIGESFGKDGDQCQNKTPKLFFEKDGHIYTTASIAKIALDDSSRKYALSYYSQYPDLNNNYLAVPVAIKYLLIPWKWGWRNDVTGKLHSLHGGNNNDIVSRRKILFGALRSTIKNAEDDWLSGLLIHALGDSYAHTNGKFGSANESAYGPWFGHVIPSLFGKSPDDITGGTGRNKYFQYIDALYELMKSDNSTNDKYSKFKYDVEKVACKNGKCPNFHDLLLVSEDAGSLLDDFSACMNKSSRQLTREEVRKAIRLIPDSS